MTKRYELGACPACNTSDFVTLADGGQIRQQLESLWEFHTQRLRSGAPVQQLFDRAVFSQDPPLHIVQCRACGTVLRNPREVADEVVDIYAGDKLPEQALTDLFDAQRAFYEGRMSRLGEPGKLLEVGSYLGAFLVSATDAGWVAEGIDVNERAIAFARARGCHVSEATIEEMNGKAQYDVVAFWNCFDQLPDPRAALLAARELLRPEGVLVIRVPNGAFYAAMLGRSFGSWLLAHNNLLAFPYRFGFTSRALARLLEDAGLTIVGLHGDTLVPTAGRWTKPWAAVEEALTKATLRTLMPRGLAPWLEVYAS